jgi:hypothetical protein
MKLMTLNQYMKMSKAALIRKITKQLRTMPKAKLARLCYTMTKAKLPRLSIRERRLTSRPLVRTQFAYSQGTKRTLVKRKTKRKFSRKQLAAQRLFAKRARAGTLRKGRARKWVRR